MYFFFYIRMDFVHVRELKSVGVYDKSVWISPWTQVRVDLTHVRERKSVIFYHVSPWTHVRVCFIQVREGKSVNYSKFAGVLN